MESKDEDFIEKALSGDRAKIDVLVNRLSPIIHSQITLLMNGLLLNQDYHYGFQDVDDLCQEILMMLFQENKSMLRQWKAEKGLSLKNFVALVTRRKVISALRIRKNRYHQDEPFDEEHLSHTVSENVLEKQITDQNLINYIIENMHATLSDLGYNIFTELYVLENSPEEAARNLKITKNAVYVWRTRIRRQIKSNMCANISYGTGSL